MKDFLGKEIHVGDKIVYCRTHESSFDMIKTEVIGFTETRLKIPQTNYLRDQAYSLVTPTNCIVYET